ncbi:MAG: sigma-70 family RNA polymerase sigma factor [Acidobacteria bacterium]|nr:sigma-70 family RNA polymerase sigma factor [Acidobacteriota bacterium]
MEQAQSNVTALLRAWQNGDQEARQQLMTILYQELRRLAAHYFRAQKPGHTLQPTALVHELYLRLFSGAPPAIRDRGHLMALAARQLRNLLVDHARARAAQKRGGVRVDLQVADHRAAEPAGTDIETLDQALRKLENLDPRAAQVVELRFFGGLTEKEVAETLGLSTASVRRDWDFARTWLLAQMKG